MENKELAVELVKARLEHNAKLKHGNGASLGQLFMPKDVAKEIAYYTQVLDGKIDPFKESGNSK